jgi:hypothetical protein
MMFSANEIASALDANSCMSSLEEMFEGRDRGPCFDACALLLREQRAETLVAVADVVDEADLALLIATRYIEQKARWIQWNLVLNYRMMMIGTFDAELAFKASVLSNLLGRIEPFIDDASLARINELLNEPILLASN